LNGSYDRLEVLLSEIRPLVVVNRLVNRSLLDSGGGVRCGQGSFAFRRSFLVSLVPPRLRSVGRLAVQI
jgi:hypothetical protein